MPHLDRARLLEQGLPPASLRRRALALDLAEAALEAVEPRRVTAQAVERLRSAGAAVDGATLFAFGKASVAMARGALDVCRPGGGVVLALEDASLAGLTVLRASHPLPAAGADRSGREVMRLARGLRAGQAALCLVSGGGSAMLELPREGVRLDEIAELTDRLMRAGADIGELNAVRRALSQVKGGGLAAAIAPAEVLNVILSDVPGHPAPVVASGPTCPPPSQTDPVLVLRRAGLWPPASEPLRRALQAASETAERHLDRQPRIRTELAADNRTAREALVAEARSRGVELEDRAGFFEGEARELGARLAAEATGGGWVWGGETTVDVRGGGRGGRNQEVALGALAAGWSRGLLLCLATDGSDGKSDTAGAMIDPHTLPAARALGLDPEEHLDENDSAPFFEAVGGALRSAPTGTNVADLCVYLP